LNSHEITLLQRKLHSATTAIQLRYQPLIFLPFLTANATTDDLPPVAATGGKEIAVQTLYQLQYLVGILTTTTHNAFIGERHPPINAVL